MTKDYTKQHIVPKSYLNRFGTKVGKKTLIGIRLIKNGKPTFFTDATDDVGYI